MASLPIEIDVNVTAQKITSVTKPDLQTAVFLYLVSSGTESDVTTPLQGPQDNRILFYDTIEDLENYFDNTESENDQGDNHIVLSGQDYYAQDTGSSKYAVAPIFDTDTAALFFGGTISATLAEFQAITDGYVAFEVDGVNEVRTGLDFSTDLSLTDVAATLTTAFTGILTFTYNATLNAFIVTNVQTASGPTATLSGAIDTSEVGTYVGASDFINCEKPTTYAGTTFVDYETELNNVLNAANNANRFVFGWLPSYGLSVTQSPKVFQEDFASFIQGQKRAVGAVIAYENGHVSSPNEDAKLSSETGDIGSVLSTGTFGSIMRAYHHSNLEYPHSGILAQFLGVDYAESNSTITGKFKSLEGITTTSLTLSELNVLEGKLYNVYTLMNNGATVWREGINDTTYYTDDWINIQNFALDLETSIYNEFLRRPKVPYTVEGQIGIVAVIQQVCNQYVLNGMLAPRQIENTALRSGVETLPAFQIVPTPIQDATPAQRAARQAPPILVIGQLAGAMHQININVNLFG